MTFKIRPWAHQLTAIQNAAFLPWYALFFEMGTGKSGTAINILRTKYQEKGRILRTLIFAPPIVVANWRDEWFKNSMISSKQITALSGSGVQRLAIFNKLSGEPGHVFLTNYESLLMKNLFEAFCNWGPEAIVWDESHKLKDYRSKRAKLADHLSNPPARQKPFTYILSGSPVLNSPLDIFQQFKILDGGQAFGKNYFSFRARYFRDRNEGMPRDRYFPKWEIRNLQKDGFDGVGEINSRIYEKGMRVEKVECLDLPPEVSTTIKVGMSKDQERLYNEMRKDLITFYNSKACTAQLAITKALRLMQITSGFVAVEDKSVEAEDPTIELQLKETPKLEALKGLLTECQEQGKKVIVWAVWKENYRQIRELLTKMKIQFCEVHGEISPVQKNLAVKTFQTDPTCMVYLGHPGSGGIGINLTVSDTSIFYSRTFSLEHYLQARARNHRGGSKEAGHEKITHYDLVCEGTIDELVVQKLGQKLQMSDQLLRDMVKETV